MGYQLWFLNLNHHPEMKRSMLSIKNIFISTLNDSEEVNANFLSDINNYNTSDANSNNSLETLKLIIDKQGNRHSKPIQRKRKQKRVNQKTKNSPLIQQIYETVFR